MSATTLRTPSENSMKIWQARYLEPNESLDHLFHRVAGGNEDFERIMRNLDFLPNSPTLMNKGTGKKGTSSACFVFDVTDSMLEGNDSIMGTATKAAAVAKWGGGVGYYLGNLRAYGAPIQSTHRVACGPIGVLKFYNEIAKLITQGGRRELAQMGILPHWHPNIRDFIHVKDANPQALRTFNISVSVSDAFMTEAMKAGTKEAELWSEIIASAWKTGDPGLFFFDTTNRFNPTPHIGVLNATNPCGEQPLIGCTGGEACNLGSINLANFVTVNRKVDWSRLEEITVASIRFLDHILDTNQFPHPDIEHAVRLTRKIGLGVMGWADMLALMHIHYDTEKALLLADEVMGFINTLSRDTSIKLANEKNGPYPGSDGDPCHHAVRTNCAPTGTISILADCSSGIEPHFALEWDRKINAGSEGLKEETIKERIPVWDKLDGFVPKTAMQVSWEWHVRQQAAFQKHLDQACSKTINLPNDATKEDISAAYRLMWQLGCKGGTIFRDGCRQGGEQVLYAKDSKPKAAVVAAPAIEQLKARAEVLEALSTVNGNGHTNGHAKSDKTQLPRERKSITHHMTIGGQFDGFIHAGHDDNGNLLEIFITAGKEGSTVSGLLDSWAIMVSYYLQAGGGLDKLVKKFSGLRFEPCGMTGNPEIPICTSIQDYVVRWLDKRFGKGRADTNYKGEAVKSGMLCPDCQGSAEYQCGCLTCKACGWSKCG